MQIKLKMICVIHLFLVILQPEMKFAILYIKENNYGILKTCCR